MRLEEFGCSAHQCRIRCISEGSRTWLRVGGGLWMDMMLFANAKKCVLAGAYNERRYGMRAR